MSGLVLRLRAPLDERIDLSAVAPHAAAAQDPDTLRRVVVANGRRTLSLGDVFFVTGSAGDRLEIESTSGMDGLGTGLAGGTIVAEGDAGDAIARGMRKGRLEIRGRAGSHLASGMRGGLVIVGGDAGPQVGAAHPGERFGMAGGTVVIGGDSGERTGDRMRRGTILIRGKAGPAAGSRMMGGTIWAERGFGAGPGPLLRRGTLIGPSAEHLLPTFADCGLHDMVVLRLLDRYMSETLGDLAPPRLPPKVRRLAGDLATIGKGEILLTT